MKVSRWLLGAAVVLAALAFAAPAVQADEVPKAEARANVELVFKMGRIEDGQKVQYKSYRLVVAEGEAGSRLLAGQRVPFPGADGGPIVYQNIGFATEARVWMLDKKTIRVVADIEDSRVIQDEVGAPPRVETRQLAVTAVLTEGVPLELTRVDGVADLAGYVDLEVRILR